jgi:hypothetical protein
MIEKLKEFFRTPDANALAQRELEEARRELLRSMSAQDYFNRIVQYHEDRIKRLSEYLNG